MKEITAKYGCLSLGEGAPEAIPPKFARDEVIKAIDEGHNQYCRTFGHPILVESVAKEYGPRFGRHLNSNTEILITNGANGALSAFILGLTDPHDEVVVIEPCFPLYLDHLRIAEAVVKSVPLEYSHAEDTWKLNLEVFRNTLSSKTKMLIINNPNNPTGKCFNKEEL